MSSTLYPPPTAFMNGRLSKRASAILNGANPSINSLNLLELDELLGWAESAKATPHQSAALDELDKLLGEFNIETMERLDKKLAAARPQFRNSHSFHTSETDIRSGEPPPLENRVFSEPGMETCVQPSFDQFSHFVIPTPSPSLTKMDESMAKNYPPELLHNFFGRRNLNDTESEISSISPHKPISYAPSVCSTISRYNQSFSSSEKASNYTMFSHQHRRDVYSQLLNGNPKFSTLLSRGTIRNDCNTLRETGTLRSNASTLRSNASTLRGNTANQPLKSSRRKRYRCKFLLCTPV